MSDAQARSAALLAPSDDPPANPFTQSLETPGTEEITTSLPVDHYGTSVYVKILRHITTTRPPVVLVHDICEHSDNYLPAAQLLLDGGYSVYLYDLRGHGRSGRQLGHAPSFATHVKDLLQVAAWVRYEEGGRPPVVLGHGVGALIAMDFSKLYAPFCQAAILSAPAFDLAVPVSAFKRLVIKLLADVLPMTRIPILLKPRLTKDRGALPTANGSQQQASGRFPGLTAIFTYELLQAIKQAEAAFAQYRGTALLLCPDKDGLFSYQALKKAAAIHQEPNLEVVALPGTTHSVFTSDEASRTTAVKHILAWLEQRAQPRPLAAAAPPEADLNTPS